MSIRKNGNSVNGITKSGYGNGLNVTEPLTPKLVEVSQGDYFELFVYAGVGDRIRPDAYNCTFVTVEAVD